MPIGNGVVALISSTTVSKNEHVVIAWQTDNPEIVSFDIRVGTQGGRWDILSATVGNRVREIRLPSLPPDLTPLFLEFGYTIPSGTGMHGHTHYENVLLTENPIEISRV